MEARTLKVQGRTVRLWSGGSGPPMLLLHGGMTDAERHWRPIWDRLAERFTVHAPDWPGFGGSAPLGRPNYPRLVAWIEALRRALGAPKLIIVGNSFGGTLGRLYAAEHPQHVEKLILLNGGGFLPRPKLWQRLVLASPWGAVMMRQRSRMGFGREAVLRMFADPSGIDPEVLDASAASGEIYGVSRHCLSGPAPRTDWGVVPTLVVWGAEDRLAPLQAGEALAEEAPHLAFHAIAGAGHLPQLEQPEATAAAIFGFCAP